MIRAVSIASAFLDERSMSEYRGCEPAAGVAFPSILKAINHPSGWPESDEGLPRVETNKVINAEGVESRPKCC